MIRLSKTIFPTAILILCLAGCRSSISSQATVISQPQTIRTVHATPVAPPKRVNTNPNVIHQSYTQEKSYTADPDIVRIKMVSKLDSIMNDPFLQKSQMGLYIYDLTKQCPVYESGKTQSMRPASTMKVITAVTALAQLGTHYEYSTKLYTTGTVQNKTLTGSLYVKGGFDPLTGNETINEFVSAIAKKGIRSVKGNIVLDLSMKDDKEAGWGWCWDDRNPSLTPLLYNEQPTFGTALHRALLNRGIRVAGQVTVGRVPQHAQNLKTHHTSIDQALRPMMKMSVNLVAESMFFQIAAQQGKPYVTHRTGAAYVKHFIGNQLHLIPENYRIADGSGLSLYNYITPELLVAALRYAYQHQDIYRHLLPSLPVAGEDGTLKNRMRYSPAHGNVCAKTGTVTGICSLAGYATAKNGHRLCFAIINQGQMSGSEARNFQDKICYIMTE